MRARREVRSTEAEPGDSSISGKSRGTESERWKNSREKSGQTLGGQERWAEAEGGTRAPHSLLRFSAVLLTSNGNCPLITDGELGLRKITKLSRVRE